MSKQGIVTAGTVAFSNLTQFDVYKGKPTGKYTLTVTLNDADAAKLRDMGVTVREYQPKDSDEVIPQRKFSSQFNVKVVDLDGAPWQGEIPYGSKVRVLWVAGDVHPEHGLTTYMNAVRVVEAAESTTEVPDEF